MEKKKVGQFQRASEELEQQNLRVQPPLTQITSGELDNRHAKKRDKVTFYLTPEQADKLEDLAYQHRKIKGKRINRNEIVRYLIDHCSIEWLKDL